MKRENIPYYIVVLAIIAVMYRAYENRPSNTISIFEEGKLEQVEEKKSIVFRQKIERDTQATLSYQGANIHP